MKKLYLSQKVVFVLIAFLVFLINYDVNAQPYYFYSELISSNYNNIYRINLTTGEKELFLPSVDNRLNLAWDNYQKWFFLSNRYGISIFNPENPSIIDSFETNEIGVSGLVVPSKNFLYISWPEEDIDNWIFKTAILNSNNLSKIKECSISITPLDFVSNNENFIYQIGQDSLGNDFIDKYSIDLDTIISTKFLSDLGSNETFFFNYGKRDKVLFSYDQIIGDMNSQKYLVYDLDNNSFYSQISFPFRSYGYLSPNAEYVILQKALWDTTKPTAENLNGEISIYKISTGELVSNLDLPPDGKILLFDSYPNMFFYYIPETNQSISIDLTRLHEVQDSSLVVKLINSTGTLLTGGTLQYYQGGWKDAVDNGDGTFKVITELPSVSLRMTYEYATQTVSNIPAQNNTYTFQTVNAQVQLQNSQGNPIDTGTVQYYAGAWRAFGTTTNGVATKELLPNNYSFRMSYGYSSNDKQQNIGTNPTVVFQTVNATVQLQNSQSNLIDQGIVQYYAGAWRDFGTTVNGVVTKELLPNNYSFRMTYSYSSNDKQQNIGTNPTVVFQTVNAAVQLQNSQSNLIDQGTVQYYAGAWREFGTTVNGVIAKELLPNNYSFRMSYAYSSNDKQQNIGTNPTVIFQTVNATVQLQNSLGNLIDQGTVQYYAGAWREFGTTTNGVATKELLPNNYSFRMSYEYISNDKQQNIGTNSTVTFSTVLCTVKVNNTQGQPINNADVKYYAGAWRQIGLTSNGEITKELLPANISFRASYGGVQQDKAQNISTNNVVEIIVNIGQ